MVCRAKGVGASHHQATYLEICKPQLAQPTPSGPHLPAGDMVSCSLPYFWPNTSRIQSEIACPPTWPWVGLMLAARVSWHRALMHEREVSGGRRMRVRQVTSSHVPMLCSVCRGWHRNVQRIAYVPIQ